MNEGSADEYQKRLERGFNHLIGLAMHYAELLNDLDDGKRVVPATIEKYLDRLDNITNPTTKEESQQ